MKISKIFLMIVLFFLIVTLYFLVLQKPESSYRKTSVMMPFISQIQWSPFYVARYKGFYHEEGLDVDIVYSTRGSAGPIEQVAAGNVDFGTSTTDTIVMSGSKGVDVVSIYPHEPVNVFYVLSKKEKNINTPEDLMGKQIGMISSASGSYSNLLVILNSFSMNEDQINLVFTGPAVITSFLEDKVDAIACHLSQKLVIESKDVEINVIKAYDFTNIGAGHIITSNRMIQSDPELVEKFVRATKRGLQYAVDHPEETVDIFIHYNPDAAKERDVHRNFWNAFIDVHGYKEYVPQNYTKEYWEDAQNVLFDIGLVDEKIDVTKIYTNQFKTD